MTLALRAGVRRVHCVEHWTFGIAARLDIHRETVRATVEHESYRVRRGIRLRRLVQRPRPESGRAVCRLMVILQPRFGEGVFSRGPAAVEPGPQVGVRLFSNGGMPL